MMMNTYFFTLVLTSFVISSQSFNAQEEDEACLPPNKKVLKKIDEAKSATDVLTTVTAFNDAIALNPDNATPYYEFAMYAYKTALEYFEKYPTPQMGNKSFEKAEKMFKLTIEHCSDFHADCYYLLGVINYSQAEMDEAIKWFKKFKDFKHADYERFPEDYAKKVQDIDDVIKDYDEEQALLKNKVPFDPMLVTNVSSEEFPEYFPMISPDNELMFFTRKVDVREIGSFVAVMEEHFSFATRSNISTPFDKGQKFSAPFNTGEFTSYGAATMSVDNKEMIICACKDEMQNSGKSYLNCDLYRTEYERSGKGGNDFTWTPLENMGDGINTPNGWEGQPTLSADGNIMYFTAMRPTTKDNDIYVVYRDKNGKWGNAMPFDEINTAGKDKSPFLHQDSETLYFVSTCTDERKGAGGLDIFYIRKENGKWSKPKNIGIPINSPDDELGIFVSTNGELAYYSSRTGGDWNIYAFELYAEARPSAVTIMKGELNDENGKPITDATIEVAYDGTGEKSTVRVNGNDGKYAVVVKNPTKQDVMVTVKKEGYAFDSKLITKEEFAQQAQTAPKDIALANKKTDEVPSIRPKTEVSSSVNSDVAVNVSAKNSPTNNSTQAKSSTVSNSSKADSKVTETKNSSSPSSPKVESKVTETVSANNTSPKTVSGNSISKSSSSKSLPIATSKNTPVSMPKNNLVIKKLEVGVPYTINDILFATNSSELSDRSKFILREFSNFLKENPSSKILIQGHTDNAGDATINLNLSQKRAEAVKDYLISLSISADRLNAKGYGDTMPKLANTTETNKAKNRRTDFVLESL